MNTYKSEITKDPNFTNTELCYTGAAQKRALEYRKKVLKTLEAPEEYINQTDEEIADIEF